jgi:lambda repressor-like predicted transcriptional regulator
VQSDVLIEPQIYPGFHARIRPLTATEYHELEVNIVADGCQRPLTIWAETDILLDGHHRLAICKAHDIPYQIHAVSLPDVDAAKAWMSSNQIGQRNLAPDEMAYHRGCVYEARKTAGHGVQSAGNSCLQTADTIATEYGVSPRTIKNDAAYTRAVDVIADAAGIAPSEVFTSGEDRSTVIEAARAEDKREAWQNIHLSQTSEWYTPSEYIDSARAVMGGIDVDPASNDQANETIHAGTYYTPETDGLTHDWPGRVWLNPPWGGDQAKFLASLVDQYTSGITTEAIVLVNAHATETTWFAPMWDHTLCFTDHRINFYGTAGSGSTHGSVFVYLGPNRDRFIREFQRWGYVVERVHP